MPFFVWREDGDSQRRWVLRRPPATVNARGASDTLREWRLLTVLEGTAVPHPQPLLFGHDAAVIGAPFMMMEGCRRVHPGRRAPGS
jgi:aminoglycoside phosphotransferase (APT) family kinase protein